MKLKIVILTITTIIILTAYFMIIPVKAETLSSELKTVVLLLGTKEFNIEEEGYTIISNNLDACKVGDYVIVYQHNETKELVKRDVCVIDQNGYYREDMTSIETFNDYQMELLASTSYGSNKHLLIIKFITNLDKNTGHIFMYRVENNEVIKSISLYYDVDLIVNDIQVVDNHFIMTGRVFNTLKGNYDLFIRVNSLEGLLKFDKTYGGSNEDIGKRILETDSSYLVFGKTLSNDLDFTNNLNLESSFIMEVDKTTKEIKNINYIQDDIDYQHVFYRKTDSNIFLGYDTFKNISKVLKLDFNGNLKQSIEIKKESDDHLVGMWINEEINLLYSNANKLIKRNLNNNTEEITLDADIQDVLISNSHICLLLNKDGRKIYKVLNNQGSIYELLLDDSKYHLINNGLMIEEAKKINVYNLNYLLINSIGNSILDESCQEYHDYEIIMNGKNIKHSAKTLDMVKPNQLGCYFVNYVFEDEFIFVMTKEITVYEEIGVRDGGIYDVNTIINTTSKAYLNGEYFQGEYVLKEIGEYTLELIGENFAQTIHFEVKDISVLPGIKEEEKIDLTYDITVPNLNINEVTINLTSSKEVIDVIQNDLNWIYTIPAVLSVAVIFIIVKMNF